MSLMRMALSVLLLFSVSVMCVVFLLPFTTVEFEAPVLDSDSTLSLSSVRHPVVNPYERGKRVYYTDCVFLDESRTKPSRGTCLKQHPAIDPFEGKRNATFRDWYRGDNVNRRERPPGTHTRDCAPLHFSTSENLPIVALASAPGSGNTWMRHLIQQLTGNVYGCHWPTFPSLTFSVTALHFHYLMAQVPHGIDVRLFSYW